jgi:two-component system response regulator YesN
MTNVIIVDDEKLLRQGFIHMTDWSGTGFRIVGEASNGLEALDMIERLRPDIVVTDIRMPGMDGIELTRTVKSRFPGTEVIVLSSYNDFEYVKETLQLGALDYILKPKMQVSDLLAALNKAKSKLKGQAVPAGNRGFAPDLPEDKTFLQSLLATDAVDEEWFASQIGRHGLAGMTAPYRLLLADLGLGTSQADTVEFVHMLNAILEQEGGKDEADRYVWTVSWIGPTHAAILLRELGAGEAEARRRGWPERLERTLGRRVRFWMSEPIGRAADIPDTYRRLRSLLPYRFYFDESGLLAETEIAESGETVDVSYRRLQSCVERGDLSPILAELCERCRRIGSNGRYIEPYVLKKNLVEACYYVIHKMDELGYDAADLHRKKIDYFKSIEESPDLAACLKELERVFGEIQKQLLTSAPPSYGATVRAVLEYIQSHYREDISLQSVAGHFHLNKSYLSQLFKQQTGENFSNYLTRLRIEKAKELLRMPDQNLFSVCEAVGFWNTSYFGQVFKKSVGLTPSDYAKQFRKPAAGKPLQS